MMEGLTEYPFEDMIPKRFPSGRIIPKDLRKKLIIEYKCVKK
jgi:hypothetical protein